IFPDRWKTEVVKVLLEGKEKDPTNIKSYRPICLPPSLGKAYERIILNKLQKVIHLDPSEYGFKQHSSTIDTIDFVKSKINTTQHRYILCIFVYIKDKELGLDRIAYADDLLIMIEGNSRSDIEHNEAIIEMNRLCEWCKFNKLEISKDKMQIMWLKG
ncbi:hypothetical protein J437_LFUL014850, partial [Ladona fulva]